MTEPAISDGLRRKSQIYGAAQTLLLFAFAAVFYLDAGPLLFAPGRSAIFGDALCAIGIALMLAAFISLRKVIQIAPEPREGGQLVTGGVYRWLRHPIYTAIAIMVIGLFLTKPTLEIAIAAAVAIGFLLIKARFEEELLDIRYPDYSSYRKRTSGVIPGLG